MVRTIDNVCWYHDVTRYRVNWTLHHLAYNQSSDTYYVAAGPNPGETGCTPAWHPSYTTSVVRDYHAQVFVDPCGDVNYVPMAVDDPSTFDYGCGDFTPASSFNMGPGEVVNIYGQGILSGPIAADEGGGTVAQINYSFNTIGDYGYEVVAQSTGIKGSGNQVVVETGDLLQKITGRNCSECVANNPGEEPEPDQDGDGIPDHEDDSDGDGLTDDIDPTPNGEPDPIGGGGPDNPEGLVCCYFDDGTGNYIRVEMSYNECLGALDASYTTGPCPPDYGCSDCCEAVLAILEGWDQDEFVIWRNWMTETWPAFETSLLEDTQAIADWAGEEWDQFVIEFTLFKGWFNPDDPPAPVPGYVFDPPTGVPTSLGPEFTETIEPWLQAEDTTRMNAADQFIQQFYGDRWSDVEDVFGPPISPVITVPIPYMANLVIDPAAVSAELAYIRGFLDPLIWLFFIKWSIWRIFDEVRRF